MFHVVCFILFCAKKSKTGQYNKYVITYKLKTSFKISTSAFVLMSSSISKPGTMDDSWRFIASVPNTWIPEKHLTDVPEKMVDFITTLRDTHSVN